MATEDATSKSWLFPGGAAVPRVQVPTAQRLILENVDWRTYERLLRAFEGRPSIRLTYDRGVLEIMSPSQRHDSVSYLLGRFIDTLTEELGQAVRAGRSMTLRNPRRRRG